MAGYNVKDKFKDTKQRQGGGDEYNKEDTKAWIEDTKSHFITYYYNLTHRGKNDTGFLTRDSGLRERAVEIGKDYYKKDAGQREDCAQEARKVAERKKLLLSCVFGMHRPFQGNNLGEIINMFETLPNQEINKKTFSEIARTLIAIQDIVMSKNNELVPSALLFQLPTDSNLMDYVKSLYPGRFEKMGSSKMDNKEGYVVEPLRKADKFAGDFRNDKRYNDWVGGNTLIFTDKEMKDFSIRARGNSFKNCIKTAKNLDEIIKFLHTQGAGKEILIGEEIFAIDEVANYLQALKNKAKARLNTSDPDFEQQINRVFKAERAGIVSPATAGGKAPQAGIIARIRNIFGG